MLLCAAAMIDRDFLDLLLLWSATIADDAVGWIRVLKARRRPDARKQSLEATRDTGAVDLVGKALQSRAVLATAKTNNINLNTCI